MFANPPSILDIKPPFAEEEKKTQPILSSKSKKNEKPIAMKKKRQDPQEANESLEEEYGYEEIQQTGCRIDKCDPQLNS